MRLIDADATIADLLTVDPQYEIMIDWCCRVLEAQPTVDAAPVSEMLKVITELHKAEKERDYWMNKAHSYETTILRLIESITPKESEQ